MRKPRLLHVLPNPRTAPNHLEEDRAAALPHELPSGERRGIGGARREKVRWCRGLPEWSLSQNHSVTPPRDVRFAPIATEFARRREMTRCATTGRWPTYSITWSARTRIAVGNTIPSSLAAFMLMASFQSGWKFDRKIGGAGSVQYFVNVSRCAMDARIKINSIANEPAGLHVHAISVDSGNARCRSRSGDPCLF